MEPRGAARPLQRQTSTASQKLTRSATVVFVARAALKILAPSMKMGRSVFLRDGDGFRIPALCNGQPPVQVKGIFQADQAGPCPLDAGGHDRLVEFPRFIGSRIAFQGPRLGARQREIPPVSRL